MLGKRLISGAALVLIIIATIFVKWFFNIMIISFIVCGLYEFFTMLEKKGLNLYKYFGIGIGTIIPLSIMIRFELTKRWEFLFIVLTLLFLIIMQFKRRQNSGVIVDISTTLFGILYISWFLSFLIKIRYLPEGAGLFSCVLLITKLGDIGAYFVGTRFGKTPLIPHISPKNQLRALLRG